MWTTQQENAINSTGRSVIVSAAAGSGKTAVLVERLVRQITDEKNPIKADKIIIVTFTNNAAAELRQRINIKLQEIINENSDNRFLLKQYTLFQSAKISTINSFCFDILRNNTEKLDITSGFSILDDVETSLLLQQSAEDVMELWSGKYPEKYEILYDKFCVKSDENIKEILIEMNNFLASMPQCTLWLENARNEFQKDMKGTLYFKKFMEISKTELNNALLIANKNIDVMSEMETVTNKEQNALEKLSSVIDDDIVLIQKCIKSLETGIVVDVNFARLPAISGLSDSEQIKSNRETYKKIISSYVENYNNLEDDLKENAVVYSVIYEIMLDFYDILWQKKCEKNGLSFDDGERLVADMLIDYDKNGNIIQSEMAKAMSQEYDIIMIDEYQDSNDKQDIIFKLLSRNFNPIENKYGENVFLVGDVKQSIYRFRLANPDNFIDTLAKSEPDLTKKDCKNVSVYLNKNFRSSPEVIDYVNYVFENIMSKSCGDIDYNDDEKLYFGAESEYPIPDNSRKTEIALIEDNSDSEINLDAEYIADKISYMINSGYEVNLKDGKKRQCEPKDFCILMRETKKSSSIFVDALKRKGIYAKGDDEKGYLKSREIVILLDILRIIDNPLLEVPMTAVMMSPMFIFNAQEIAEIKAIDSNSKLYVNLLKICDGDVEISEILREKCQDFLDVLKNFRMYSVVYTVEELIEKIYDTTDFLTIMQQFVDGEKKKANLRLLMQYAKSYETNTNSESEGGLSGFLRYIERIQSNKSDLTQGKISAVSENFVSIKTIHKSKGLEYPFIFLAKLEIDFSRKFVMFEKGKQVMCGQDNMIGFKLNQPYVMRKIETAPYSILSAEKKKNQSSEEMRLLYVALTRAKQKLFISLSVDEKSLVNVCRLYEIFEKNDFDVKNTSSQAKRISDWIWLTIFIDEKFQKICEKYNLLFEYTEQLKSDLFDISYFSNSDVKKSVSENEFLKNIEPDMEKIENIKNIMNYQYDFSRSKLPAKMTVTQLISKDDEHEIEITLNQPQFILENTNMVNGAKRGTVIHKFFQFYDFKKDVENLDDIYLEIYEMIDKNYFTDDEAQLLPLDKIKAFLNSELCQRIKSADKIERERNFMLEVKDLNLNYKSDLYPEFLNSDGMIVGVIDLVIHEPDGLVIVDYKSDRGKSENAIRNRYAEQLELYKSALELVTNKKVKEKLIYSLELEKIIKM